MLSLVPTYRNHHIAPLLVSTLRTNSHHANCPKPEDEVTRMIGVAENAAPGLDISRIQQGPAWNCGSLPNARCSRSSIQCPSRKVSKNSALVH
ncbi:hypothetical protein CERSUDRAFT_84409 [Gelatoporia subvermispora B]|uniref:Uncharacterized protein n=1 Tax=Ceriporiopsis subvermispora (strain B) TaxID=914234 RepID=M2RD25_CERS8|nr:hypothetical protein CERSUDRAFT_84409 [Gelatoporia subvermispora B]